MRCYFMRGGRIENVAYLKSGPDADLIRQAKALLPEYAAQKYVGIEVWDGNRFVYREHAATGEAEFAKPRRD